MIVHRYILAVQNNSEVSSVVFLSLKLFREPMATRVKVDDNGSSPHPSRSCSTAAVHKWTCAALKTWLKVDGLSYSGMKKDELVVK